MNIFALSFLRYNHIKPIEVEWNLLIEFTVNALHTCKIAEKRAKKTNPFYYIDFAISVQKLLKTKQLDRYI